jgi:hypothetical protein
LEFEDVLQTFEDNPMTSTIAIAHEMGITKITVWTIFHEEMLYPSHIQKVHALVEEEYPRRLEFSHWVL